MWYSLVSRNHEKKNHHKISIKNLTLFKKFRETLTLEKNYIYFPQKNLMPSIISVLIRDLIGLRWWMENNSIWSFVLCISTQLFNYLLSLAVQTAMVLSGRPKSPWWQSNHNSYDCRNTCSIATDLLHTNDLLHLYVCTYKFAMTSWCLVINLPT